MAARLSLGLWGTSRQRAPYILSPIRCSSIIRQRPLRRALVRYLARPLSTSSQRLANFPPPARPEERDDAVSGAGPSTHHVPSELHESPYTWPNALTVARIIACPFLGYTIVQGDFAWATGILAASGFSDWVSSLEIAGAHMQLDGWIARRYKSMSVLGSILDPAADKALMTTLVGTLAWSGLLPSRSETHAFSMVDTQSPWQSSYSGATLPYPSQRSTFASSPFPSRSVTPANERS